MKPTSPPLSQDQQKDLESLVHEVKQSIADVRREREVRENDDVAKQISQSIQSSTVTLL